MKKCPNCGHEFKKGEEYCPNCDLFVPVNETDQSKNTFDPHATKKFKAFNEKDIEKQITEEFNEPTFKHRNKTSDESNLPKEKEIVSESNETQFTENKKELDNEVNTAVEKVAHGTSDRPVEEYIEKEYKETENNVAPERIANTTIEEKEIEEEIEAEHKPKKNKKRAIIGMSAAVLLIAGGITFYSSQQKKADEKVTTELISKASFNLNSLYSNSEHIFLKESISNKDIDKAKDSLDKLKGKPDYSELKKDFDQIEEKYNKQTAINNLFKKPIIEGEKVNADVFVKNSNHIPINKVLTEKDNFDTNYNKAFAEAEAQKKVLKKAEDSLSVVFKDNEVIKSATKKQVETAEKEIKEIKDPEQKKNLQENLDKVKTYLEKDNKEKEKANAEAEKQAQVEKQQTSENNNNNVINDKEANSTNRWGNRQDESINYSDAAWGWNQGVQEKVVSEVINRGYVVDGGYSLVPKYVENGEGFYDLYATTNSKLFPKSKPEEFPIYVVTINSKTGWFKGNGPN